MKREPTMVQAGVYGSIMHYLAAVKSPSESQGPWDYYKQIAAIPREEAFKPLGPNECYMTRSFTQ